MYPEVMNGSDAKEIDLVLPTEEGQQTMFEFGTLLSIIERLHRRLLDVLKVELERRLPARLNAVQALLLYNIGDSVLTAGELRSRGHYLGSNVSYNLKKLVNLGFIDYARSPDDRRSVTVKLTEDGQIVRQLVEEILLAQCQALESEHWFGAAELGQVNDVLRGLERFWAGRLTP